MNDTKRYEALRALYGMPQLQCKGLCQACCGAITMTRVEFGQLRRIKPEIHARRVQTKTEGGYSLGSQYLIKTENGKCPLLQNGQCGAYEYRPMICRLWGLTQTMVCSHGCQPERVLTEKEALGFMTEAAKLGF